VIRGAVGAGEHWLPVASYDDLITFMAGAGEWAVAKPGERWFYLNEGYVLLGYIIEKCSGLSYEEYVKTCILEPLGMTRSFFDKDTVEKDQDTATPYIVTQNGERKPSTYPYGSITSDGGLISNVVDLARYVSMFLGSGEYHGGRLLSRESLVAMEAPQVLEGWEGPFGDLAYGYGLGITPDFLGHKLVGHSGSLLVATAYMGFIPEKHVGIALLANGTGYPLSQLGMYGLAILVGEDPEKLPFVQNERALKELEGTYETYKGTMKLRVKRSGDFLNVERADKYTKDVGILVPDVIGEKTRLFYLLSGGYKLPVEFSVHEGDVDLLYERYRLKKTGSLP
jgi:CubicO group peptidase (beta-lactamase class C family)